MMGREIVICGGTIQEQSLHTEFFAAFCAQVCGALSFVEFSTTRGLFESYQ